jgi:cell wall-associated NlpC family hydrolase
LSGLDRRLNAFRDDLADAALRDTVRASTYVEGTPARIGRPVVPVRPAPDPTRARDTEFLFGEPVTLFEEKDGWAWVQSRRDGYVGYVEADAVLTFAPVPTHRVSAIRTHAYPAPDLKRFAITALTVGSQVTVVDRDGSWSRVADGTWFPSGHLTPLESHDGDPAAEALRFLEAPYLWGGRSSEGLDCSALIQFALEACGVPCPRDTDMQEVALGRVVDRDTAPLRRSDLVFWPGHVGMMIDANRIVHANATDMATRVWDLDKLAAHIERIEGNPIRVIKRL